MGHRTSDAHRQRSVQAPWGPAQREARPMDPRSFVIGARIARRLPNGQTHEGVVSGCALDSNNEYLWTVRCVV